MEKRSLRGTNRAHAGHRDRRAHKGRKVAGAVARRKAWSLGLAAMAYASAKDTARLAALADSIEHVAVGSAYGRDRKLPFYVRGLLYEARGDLAAAEASFRNAMYSPNVGFTRVNLELARVLVAANRPRDAVPVLRSALRGGLDGSNYYVTRTELTGALAEAFAAAGDADSARVYGARARAARSHGARASHARDATGR